MDIEATRAIRNLRRQERIAALRAQAAAKMEKFNRIDGSMNRDSAFGTQPVPSNSQASRFIAARNRERSKFDMAMRLYQEAQALTAEADSLERTAVRVAGDAERENEAIIAETEVVVGDLVNCIYGVRRVTKVNAKSVKIEAATGDLTIPKHLIKVIRRAA